MSSWKNLLKSFSALYWHEWAHWRVFTRSTLPFSFASVASASDPASPAASGSAVSGETSSSSFVSPNS